MGHSSRRVILSIATAVVFASCSSKSGSSPSTATQAPDSAPTIVPTGGQDTFGVPTAVGDLMVTLSDPLVESDASGPWLTLTARAENQSNAGAQPPTFELRCAGSGAGGGWLTSSTFKLTETIEAGAASEGTISLLLPGDDRSGGSRPSCNAPVEVIASVLSIGATGQPAHDQVEWEVPGNLVKQLNDV